MKRIIYIIFATLLSLNLTTTAQVLDENFPQFDGEINEILTDSNYYYLGGLFTAKTNDKLRNLVRVNKHTFELDTIWNPYAPFEVYDPFTEIPLEIISMAQNEKFLFISTAYYADYKEAYDYSKLWKIDKSSGKFILNWLVKSDKIVSQHSSYYVLIRNLIANDKYIWCYGNFKIKNSSENIRLVKIDIETAEIDTNWRVEIKNRFYSWILKENEMYISGSFDVINGLKQANIAKIDALTGVVDSLWNPFLDKPTYINSIVDNNIYISGDFGKFNEINGHKIQNIARLNLKDGQLDTNWNLKIPIEYFYGFLSFSVSSKYIYCLDENINKFDLNTGEAIYDWNTTMDLAFTPESKGNRYIRAIGKSLFVSGTLSIYHYDQILTFARYAIDYNTNVPIENLETYSFSISNIYPNPVNQSLLIMEYSGVDGIGNFTIFDFKGAKIGEYNNLNVTSNSVLNFNLPPNLSKGIYFITSEINGSTQSNKFMIE